MREGRLPANRSIPRSTVIPELPYPDVGKAVEWLCDAFGFTLRLRVGNHRAQLNVGDGAIVATEQRRGNQVSTGPVSLLVRVADADRHHARAKEHGSRILQPPTDHPYGERQYTAEDLAGHRWTFSQTIADVAPQDWGGTPGQL